MGKGLTATLCLIALASSAHAATELQGQWQVTAAALPDYVGIVLIDADHRVTWDSPVDRGRPAKYQGYIAKIDGTRIDAALTDRTVVVHLNCKIESSDLLHCVILFRDGSVSTPFELTRRAPGPKRLMSVLP